MAIADETVAAFRQLAQAVHQAGESGNFGADQSAALANAETALNAAIRNFAAAPGDETAQRAAAAAAGRAERMLASATPADLDAALREIADATRLLLAATGAARAHTAALPSIQGSLRIARRPAPTGVLSATGADDNIEAGGGDPTVYNKLITLFPAEALTLYGSGLAIFPNGAVKKLVVLIVCVVLLFFVRRLANTSRPVANEPTNLDAAAVWVAVTAFLLWATATDAEWLFGFYDLTGFGLPERAEVVRQWAAFLGAAFVLGATAFYTPKPLPSEGTAG
ncbi:hypothetical protein FHS95_003745 [Sphingomonas naasensis]|uniref:Uncharacterized protein n=1 Tax=Sphingomonas naasensis TaxID=1344951 RepID=A0A4S1WGZ1_9SPHN|nr:hypothetical protein [Sphingomonas naasensis]NIJ22034.1 hypothetical protein [Sphingomonas naasensis]TGX42289.1 hypothetical protein E5A74_10575 [Sphingomonas naasensis]